MLTDFETREHSGPFCKEKSNLKDLSNYYGVMKLLKKKQLIFSSH